MKTNSLRIGIQIACAVLVLALGIVGAFALVQTRSKPQREQTTPPPPLVQVLSVQATSFTADVASQGSVLPSTDTQLTAEVSGRVIEIGPQFAAGGFFEKGELLVKLEDIDYRTEVDRTRAEVARARLALAREEAEADSARREWSDNGDGEPPPLVAREPQLAEARATLQAAIATFEQAEANLRRAEIRAPFAGRVWEENVDLGQFVMRGTVLARIYSIDFAEVRLPVATDELEFLDLPMAYRDSRAAPDGPAVTLSARFAGKDWTWTGSIVRTEGEVDRRSRMLTLVARIADPYGHAAASNGQPATPLAGTRGSSDPPPRPPLSVGMFVDAAIAGRTYTDVFVLPRAALHERTRVWVVDGEDRLFLRDVEVLRRAGDQVIVRAGLSDGERVCLTNLELVADGMQVRTVDTEAPEVEGSGR